MTTYKTIAKRIVGDRFYIDDYVGLFSTGFSHSDLWHLEESPFPALELLQHAFDKELGKKFPKYVEEFELHLVYGADGNIFIGIQK